MTHNAYGTSHMCSTTEVYDVRSADILHGLGWDTLDQRRAKQLATSVYKAVNNLLYIRSHPCN
jgi:hypothetical protein